MAGMVRQKPGADDGPAGDRKKHVRNAHDQVAQAQGKGGAKEMTLQSAQQPDADVDMRDGRHAVDADRPVQGDEQEYVQREQHLAAASGAKDMW